MKLTDSKQFEGKLVHAWTEDSYRKRPVDPSNASFTIPEAYDSQRFKYVIDEQDHVLASVTDQYTLVTNRDFVSAVDIAADELGIEVEANRGSYVNGRSHYRLVLPGHSMRIPGDESVTKATLDIQNDYRGGGSLKLLAGWFRMICTNGLIVGEIASSNSQRHVGEIKLMEFVMPALAKIADRFEVERVIAEALQRQKADADLVEAIVADSADRYEADIRRAVRENARSMGDNLWALSQAVSEIATHRMQTRADGGTRTNFNSAADTWGTRQYNRILEHADVS